MSKKLLGFRNTQRDRIPIEWNAAHNDPRAGIPWVVFPEREQASWFEASKEEACGVSSVVEGDVMKDPVAKRKIK